ncbi:unnamed protein product [Rhodiola kirilowii]
MSLGKDPLSNSIGDVIPNMGSPMQVNNAGLPRGDPDMLLKLKMAQLQQQQQQNNQQQQQQLQQHSLSNQMSQNMNHNLHQQDKLVVQGAALWMVQCPTRIEQMTRLRKVKQGEKESK